MNLVHRHSETISVVVAIITNGLLLFPTLNQAAPTPTPTATPATAADAVNALASAGPTHWSVLELGSGHVSPQSNNGVGSISGNVGVSANGQLQDNGAVITGDVYLGSKAQGQFSGNYTNNRPVSGTTYLSSGSTLSNNYTYTTTSGNYDPMLSQALADATNASQIASSLTPTSSLTQINLNNASLTLNAGVYSLSTLKLDHSTLTLSGSGYFVFNISSTFNLNTGSILLANGAVDPNILFNYTGTGDAQISGGNAGPAPGGGQGESVMHGTLLAMNAKINANPVVTTGELISTKDITIGNGSIVQAAPTPAPTTTPNPTATPNPTSTPNPTATPNPTSTPNPTAPPNPSATPKASAADAFTALASAGPSHWTILEAGNGTVQEQIDASNPQGAINGNVGVTSNGKMQTSGPPINGNLYLGNSATAQFSGNYTNNTPVAGTVFLSPGASVQPTSYNFTTVSGNFQPMLDQARTDALNASSVASGLTPTSGLTQINLSHASLTLAPGVYDLSTLSLDHSTLTLSGSGDFVFNITNTFKLSSGKVLVANGASEGSILFNYTGTGDVAFSGGTGGTVPGGPDESILHGIILAMNANVNLAPGLVVGEIISGKNISIVSGAIAEHPPTVPDDGSALTLILIGLAGLAVLQLFAMRARSVVKSRA